MTRSLRLLPLAAVGLVATAAPAVAGWDNVFQLTCNRCDRPRAAFFAPAPAACPTPCPQPEARVSYVQRTYYQPVTEMRRESYYVPVTENVRSYYYEPVTSYSYSCYVDPCTGCPQEIAVPRTSYRVREQCNAVTKYVEKCRMVPVTSYRPVTVNQPVVSYYYPPVAACPPASMFAPPAAAVPPAGVAPPRVEAGQQTEGETYIPPPSVPVQPNSAPKAMPGAAKPSPGFTRTASYGPGRVSGEVVANDQRTPRPGAKLVFVSAAKTGVREYATANGFGEFDVRLPAGDWYIYLSDGSGQAVRHSKIRVTGGEARDVTLASR